MRYHVRNIIQTGVLTTVWAIGSLVTWFLIKHVLIYRIFDTTSGTVYTHVSVSLVARLYSHLNEKA